MDYASQQMAVEYDARQINSRKINHRIHQLGYDIEKNRWQTWLQTNQELARSILAGVFLLVAYFGGPFAGLPEILRNTFYLIAYILGGYSILQHSIRALLDRHFDVDTLMLVAALGAAALGEYAEGALLLFLFSLGHALEERALDRARGAIQAMADITPKVAVVRREGRELVLPVERVELGDTVIIRPGVRVPVDGEVIAGTSDVNQAPITGESLPVDKSPGETVYAGSVNGTGVLEVRATRLVQDSTLSRITKLIAQAQVQKSPTEQASDRFMRVFVPVVLAAASLLAVVPPFFGVPFRVSFLRAMTLLVATSPCALALGAPATVLTGIAQAARHGVLVKGGYHLENLGRIRAIAFDKTGTLTEGKPKLTDIVALNGYDKQEILSLAAAVEAHSAHPLAEAVVQAAIQQNLQIPRSTSAEALKGLGTRGQAGGKNILIGSVPLFQAQDANGIDRAALEVEKLEKQGKTALLVGVNDDVSAVLGITDTLRKEAPATLQDLRELGVEHAIMLSGDNPRAAAQISQQAGLSEYRAPLMPEAKLHEVQAMRTQFGAVAMVGDGINDAPALAAATVGIAMGGSATDVALETADVALLAPDLTRLPFAIGLGRKMQRITWQNLIIAMGVIAFLAVLAVSGLTSMGMAVVIHEGSTLIVVLNALRLLNFKP